MPTVDSRTIEDLRSFGDVEDERTDAQREVDSLEATAPICDVIDTNQGEIER